MDLQAEMSSVLADFDRIRAEFSKRIVDNASTLDFILKALLSGGHILMEGVPGLGKTLMVKTAAEILDLKFTRIQFTPDLMPADIIGTNLIMEDEKGHRSFHFEKGPIFANVLLTDEINRASPKTQSALLQAMEEREISAFGHTYPLDAVFMTLATQNPIEMAGTYPLPEAQLDRFMFKLQIGYPGLEALVEIAKRNVSARDSAAEAEKTLGHDRILEIREFVRRIPITDRIYEIAADVVYGTHPTAPRAPEVSRKYVKYGASPRGLNALLSSARVSAVMDGRFNLSVDDLRENLEPCLRHRIILNFEGEVESVNVGEILREIFAAVTKGR